MPDLTEALLLSLIVAVFSPSVDPRLCAGEAARHGGTSRRVHPTDWTLDRRLPFDWLDWLVARGARRTRRPHPLYRPLRYCLGRSSSSDGASSLALVDRPPRRPRPQPCRLLDLRIHAAEAHRSEPLQSLNFLRTLRSSGQTSPADPHVGLAGGHAFGPARVRGPIARAGRGLTLADRAVLAAAGGRALGRATAVRTCVGGVCRPRSRRRSGARSHRTVGLGNGIRRPACSEG